MKKQRPPSFSGIGPGKGSWKKRRYSATGEVVEDPAPAKVNRGPHVTTRFRPFVSHQVHGGAAKAVGLQRTKNRGTVFETEAQLNRYLAYEKHHGRDVGWKDHE